MECGDIPQYSITLWAAEEVDRETLNGDNLRFAGLLVEADSLLQIPKGVLIRVGGKKFWLTIIVELGQASRKVQKESMDWSWA